MALQSCAKGGRLLQASAAHYQSQLSALGTENDRLRSQLSTLSAGLGAGDHERRLDDVAQQVVRALLSQKVRPPVI